MKIKLTEMELIVLLGLVSATSQKEKSEFLKKSKTIKKQHKFTGEQIFDSVELKLFRKLKRKYEKMIDKSTK